MSSRNEVLEDIRAAITRVATVSVSKILPAADNYAAEDVMSESASAGTAYHFEGMADEDGGSGVIEKAIVWCSTTALTPRVTLYLFTHSPGTNKNDNVANTAPATADLNNFEGQIDFPAWEDLGGGSASIVTTSTSGNLPLPYKCAGTDLYGVAVTRDAITGEAAGMTLAIKLLTRKD